MRTAILNAAKNLLWEEGYESMSPRKVMDASGAGQGSLYHHFRGKKQLASEVLGEVEAELVSAAETIFAHGSPPLERLRAYLLLERNGLKGCRLGRLANETEVLANPGLRLPIASYFEKVENLVCQALTEAQAQGDLSPSLLPEDLAVTLVATVQGGFLMSRALNDPSAIKKATEGAWGLLEALARRK